MEGGNGCTRRTFLETVAAALVAPAGEPPPPAPDHGRIKPPIPVPDIIVLRHDGSSARLRDLVSHQATALQVMFTRCTTTCPIQGAIFQRVQTLIPDQRGRGIQLLSLSVDPDHDTPEVLSRWLRRFNARPGWIAASPQRQDVERVKEFAGRGRSAADDHSTQVEMINRNGLLIWRTFELPEAEEVAGILRSI